MPCLEFYLQLTFANPDSGYISLACIFYVLLSSYDKGGSWLFNTLLFSTCAVLAD